MGLLTSINAWFIAITTFQGKSINFYYYILHLQDGLGRILESYRL